MGTRFDPDDLFGRVFKAILPIWGPFYAMFYIMRLLVKEIFKGRED